MKRARVLGHELKETQAENAEVYKKLTLTLTLTLTCMTIPYHPPADST